jgi:hypothetical protein
VYGAILYAGVVLFFARLGNATAIQMHESAVLLFLFAVILIAWRLGCALVFHPARAASRLALRSGKSYTQSDLIRHVLIDCAGFARRSFVRWSNPRGTYFQQRLAARGLPSSHTIAESTLRESLEKIALIEAMLEPERIESRVPMGRLEAVSLAIMLVPIVIFVGFVLAGENRFIPAIAISVGILAAGLSRLFDLRLGESLAPVAGMGVITDRKGRRWTVESASMLVRPVANGNGLTVELLGPEDCLLMRFRRGIEDEGFQTLWQRWMHPHPRPDLV